MENNGVHAMCFCRKNLDQEVIEGMKGQRNELRHSSLWRMYAAYFCTFHTVVVTLYFCVCVRKGNTDRNRGFRSEIIISSVWTSALWLTVPRALPSPETSRTSPSPHTSPTARADLRSYSDSPHWHFRLKKTQNCPDTGSHRESTLLCSIKWFITNWLNYLTA